MQRVTTLAGMILMLFSTASMARAETMTWLVLKNHPSNAQIAFYSQTRPGHHWPASGAFNLNTSTIVTIPITCEPDEKICYGAWIDGRSNISWGAGLGGGGGCPNCCGTCGQEKAIRLDGSESPTNVSKAVTAFSWVYNAQPSPGKRTWYLDDANRWHEQYPDGHEAKVFDRVSHGTADGCAGSIARTTAEPDFQVFIPDKGCSRMVALFRRGDASWNAMGQMLAIK